MAEDISPAGVALISGLFEAIDPGHNLNPGKIVATPAEDGSEAGG